MFADPQSVTVNAVAQSMPRVSSSGQMSVYEKNDGNYKLTISHQKSKDRIRSMARVDQRIVATDPLTTEQDYESTGVYLVIDRPTVGFTMVQIEQLVAGFVSWLSTANVDKLYGGES